ncbi:MAG: hypothetical protein M3Y33_17520, partial [Actinomycetota bacterium]|nr:hypothetical protein [Actinomycetota bacterium]
MDAMTSGADLRDAARRAPECTVMGRAVTLARWIGTSPRQVTAGQVLGKADTAAAGAALGVPVPPRVRTMKDVRALHRPWCVAVETGLLQVSEGKVTGDPARECRLSDDAGLLAGWLAGLQAVCAAESYPQDGDSVRLLVLALLTVLGGDRERPDAKGGLWRAVTEALRSLCEVYDKSYWEPMHAADRYVDPETGNPPAGLAALAAEFGAAAGDADQPVITLLGRWAAGHLPAGLPALADPRLTAREMIAAAAQFSDAEQQDHVARGWLAERDTTAAAREILTAAEKLPPLLRGVAVRAAERLGQDALPAWRELDAAPRV